MNASAHVKTESNRLNAPPAPVARPIVAVAAAVPPPVAPPPAQTQALKFIWVCIDERKFPDVFIPALTRASDGRKYLSVRIIETAILDKYENVFSEEIKRFGNLSCVYCEPDEAGLLNEINETHTENFDYGLKKFDTHDTLVTLDEFKRFYEILSRTCKTKDEAQMERSRAAVQYRQSNMIGNTSGLVPQPHQPAQILQQQQPPPPRYHHHMPTSLNQFNQRAPPMPQFQPNLHNQYQTQTNSNPNNNNYIDFNLMSESLASRYNPAQAQAQSIQLQQQQIQMKRMEAAVAAQRHPNNELPFFPHQHANHHYQPHPPALNMHQHIQQQQQQQHRNLGNLTTLTQTTTTTRTLINQVLPPPPLIHQPVLAPIQLQQIFQPGAVRPISPYHPLLAEQQQHQQSNLSINIPRQVQHQLENSTTPTPPLTPSPNVANLVMPPVLTRIAPPLQPQPPQLQSSAPVNVAAAPIVARTCSRETLQLSDTQTIRDIQSIISKEMSMRARSSSCSDSSRDSDANKNLTLNSRIGMLNTPPPIPSNPVACTSKEPEPNNNNDIIVLDESSSSADSTPTSSPQKQAQAQPSSLIKQATTNNLAKKMDKIIDSYHSKPHGYIQINDMILPYTNLTEKGYVVCDMYPKCIKYVCLKHLAECNIIRVDTYANKANLKNVFRSYQVASPEQTQSLNEQVQKLTQLPGLKPNNKFSRSDRYDLINLSELFAEHAEKALYLQELELDSIPERIFTGYAEILTLTGGILQYTEPEKKKKHIQPFVDFENKKYVSNLNIKKAIDIYNSQQLEHTQLIEMSARELEPALADRFNKFYQLLLFYMNIKYDIKNRKNKFIDVKDAVDKLPNKFRILCSFTSKFPSEWVNNVLEFSARKNTPKKTAIQVPESVSLSPNSMDSGSVSPNEQQQQQNQAKSSFIEENINSIESDLSKTSKICVISDICSLNTEKPTQVLSLSVINAENESNSASSNQDETVKLSLNENENEKENNCSSSVKPAKKKLAESPEKNKSVKKECERNAFSDDVLHRRIELAAYLEIRKKIKLKRLEPNKNYLSRIEALFNKAELATAQVNTTNESELPELDLEMNESAPPKEQVEETSNESERQVPDSSINENETNVAVSVVFDLLDVSPNPCTSKSLEEEPNPIQSIQDVLNSCGLSEAAKATTKKEKPKKRANTKGSCDSMSNHDTASVTSEVASTTGSLDSKLSKKSAASQKSKRKAKNKSLKVNKKKKLNSSSNELGDGRSGTESDEDSYGEQSDYCESTSFYHKVDSMTEQGASRNRQQQQVKKNILGIENMRLKSDLYDTETFDEEFYLKKYSIKKCSVKLKRISPLTFESLLKNESKEEVKKKIKKSNMDKAETGSVKSATSSSSSAKSGKRKKVAIRKTDSVSDEL